MKIFSEAQELLSKFSDNIVSNAGSHSWVSSRDDGIDVWTKGKKYTLRNDTGISTLRTRLGQGLFSRIFGDTWFGDLIGVRTSVIIDGPIDKTIAVKLYDSGVRFVRRAEHTYTQRFDEPKKNKLIFVTSDNPELASELFGGANPQVVEPGSRLLSQNFDANISTVDSYDDMVHELFNLAEDERAVIVAHNEGGYINFPNQRMWFDELPEEVELISCNTFEYQDMGYVTTGRIYFKSIVEALTKVHTNKPVSFEDFMQEVAVTYTKQLSQEDRKYLLITTGVLAGASGGVYGVYVVASENKDNE